MPFPDAPPPVLPAPLARLLEVRRALLEEGRPSPLVVLPSDRARFELPGWTGTWFGMTCAPVVLITP